MGHRLGLDRLVHYLWRQEREHMFPEWTYTTAWALSKYHEWVQSGGKRGHSAFEF